MTDPDKQSDQIFRDGLLEPSEVHEAAGMIAAQLHISPTEAIARLRAYAQLSHRTTPHIACDVRDRTTRMGSDGATSAE